MPEKGTPSGDLPEKQRLLPPSPLRNYSFGEIEATARHAVFKEGDPRRLYLFDARDVTLGDVDLRPPFQYEESEKWSRLAAWHHDLDPPIIVYFISNTARTAMGDAYHPGLAADEEIDWEGLPPFAACHLVLELHELTHWAITEDENPDSADTKHWENWNTVLREVVEYVWPDPISWEVPEWNVEDLPDGVRTPLGVWVESISEQQEHEQATFEL